MSQLTHLVGYELPMYELPERPYYSREQHPLSTDGMVVHPEDLPYHYQAAEQVNQDLGYTHAVVGIHPNQVTLDNGVGVTPGMVRVTVGGGWLNPKHADLGSYWQTYYNLKRADQEAAATCRLFSLLRQLVRF